VLTVDERLFKRYLSQLDNNPEAFRRALVHGVRYSFSVHTYSNVRMVAGLSQNSLQPGAILTLRTNLTEYGLPIERRVDVQAELQQPDNTRTILLLAEIEPGVFETSLVASLQGIYRFRVMASGVTFRGAVFTREQLLTAAVFQGGDHPLPTSDTDTRSRDEQLCHLLDCLLKNESVRKFLGERGIDAGSLAGCVSRFCQERLAQIQEAGVPQRQLGSLNIQEMSELLAHPRLGELSALLTDILRKPNT
jgi:hypothetical protein